MFDILIIMSNVIASWLLGYFISGCNDAIGYVCVFITMVVLLIIYVSITDKHRVVCVDERFVIQRRGLVSYWDMVYNGNRTYTKKEQAIRAVRVAEDVPKSAPKVVWDSVEGDC